VTNYRELFAIVRSHHEELKRLATELEDLGVKLGHGDRDTEEQFYSCAENLAKRYCDHTEFEDELFDQHGQGLAVHWRSRIDVARVQHRAGRTWIRKLLAALIRKEYSVQELRERGNELAFVARGHMDGGEKWLETLAASE